MEERDQNEETVSPDTRARIHSVEAKLVELDPILIRFCVDNGFTFWSAVGVWPRRKIWARREFDLSLDLTTDLTVPEVMGRGYYPEMPWTLAATASLRTIPGRFLSVDVFRALPFSGLSGVLAHRLMDGVAVLQGITSEDILSKGQCHGQGI